VTPFDDERLPALQNSIDRAAIEAAKEARELLRWCASERDDALSLGPWEKSLFEKLGPITTMEEPSFPKHVASSPSFQDRRGAHEMVVERVCRMPKLARAELL
jgi:hypothetical protein